MKINAWGLKDKASNKLNVVLFSRSEARLSKMRNETVVKVEVLIKEAA